MAQEIFVQVRFSEDVLISAEKGSLSYRDALYFTQAEFAAMTQVQIDALKKTRTDAFAERVKNPPPEQPLTKEQIQAQIDRKNSEIDKLEEQLADALPAEPVDPEPVDPDPVGDVDGTEIP